MKQLASTLNSISPQRVVEPYFAKKFAEQGKLLNDYFTVSKIKFSNCATIRDVVHCKDVSNLFQFVLSARTVSDQHLADQRQFGQTTQICLTNTKLGIDGGDFLKMILGVLETTLELTSPILKLSKLSSSYLNDSGVKKDLLIRNDRCL